MKLVRLSTVYPDYLNQFYGSRPGLEKETFTRQEEALMYDAFGWADFWKEPLAPFGYDVTEIVANAGPLQKAWAEENDCRESGKDQLRRLATARVQALQPDILFINDFIYFTRGWIENVRARCPSIRLVLGWCGAPFPDAEVFKGYDVVLSCVPELVEMFRQMGLESYHLNHAFDPRILDRIADRITDPVEFTFVGQIHRQSGFHLKREQLLLALVERTPLTILSMSSRIGPGKYFMNFVRKGIHTMYGGLSDLGVPEDLLGRVPIVSRGPRYRGHPFVPIHPVLRKHLHQPVFGLEMFKVLGDSKITFNSHLNISVHSSSNLRMFESTGVGTCLLTDHFKRTSLLFEPDAEIVTYRSPEECVEKALYLLNNPDEYEKIARAGQKRTLRDHTFNVRAQDLNGIIQKYLKRG